MREKIENPDPPMPFGELRAKQSQDDKPLPQQRLVRTASVNDALWSHSSLRSRRGPRSTATWPLLTRLNLAQLIPARPFGLGWRFDETPSGSAKPFGTPRQKIQTNPRGRNKTSTKREQTQADIATKGVG
jgi:hypothetical protein